jgi:hypothetical protein
MKLWISFMEITSSSSSPIEKANTISRRISPNNLRGLIGDIQPRPQSGDIAIVISANNLLDNPKYMVKNEKMYCGVGKRFPHLKWGNSDGLFVKDRLCTWRVDNAAAIAKFKKGEKLAEEAMYKVESRLNLNTSNRYSDISFIG